MSKIRNNNVARVSRISLDERKRLETFIMLLIDIDKQVNGNNNNKKKAGTTQKSRQESGQKSQDKLTKTSYTRSVEKAKARQAGPLFLLSSLVYWFVYHAVNACLKVTHHDRHHRPHAFTFAVSHQ